MVRSGPFILGLTGSIAMGKSETASMFRRLRVPIFDADEEVHHLLGQGGKAAELVSAAFPSVMKEEAIDRQALGKLVFASSADLRLLEGILHPLVGRARKRFLRRAAGSRVSVVVVDVPLLFETRGEGRCDAVVVVSAPDFVQRQRAMSRADMTAEKLEAILARQTPDIIKRRRADFVVATGIGRRAALVAVHNILRIVRNGGCSSRRYR